MQDKKQEEQLFQIIVKMMREHENSQLLLGPITEIQEKMKTGTAAELLTIHLRMASDFNTHFQNEEKIIFPSLLRVAPTPETGMVVDQLCRDHRVFSTQLKQMERMLAAPDRPDVDGYIQGLMEFERSIKRHVEEEFEKVYLVVRNSQNMKRLIIQMALEAGLLKT
jgi:hemerythrin-like domain-containing protein